MTIKLQEKKNLRNSSKKGLKRNADFKYNQCISVIQSGNVMKVKASIKADPSKGDILVRRCGRLYVINKKDPNRKQRQKGPARKK